MQFANIIQLKYEAKCNCLKNYVFHQNLNYIYILLLFYDIFTNMISIIDLNQQKYMCSLIFKVI